MGGPIKAVFLGAPPPLLAAAAAVAAAAAAPRLSLTCAATHVHLDGLQTWITLWC